MLPDSIAPALRLLGDYMTAAGEVDPEHAALLAVAKASIGLT